MARIVQYAFCSRSCIALSPRCRQQVAQGGSGRSIRSEQLDTSLATDEESPRLVIVRRGVANTTCVAPRTGNHARNSVRRQREAYGNQHHEHYRPHHRNHQFDRPTVTRTGQNLVGRLTAGSSPLSSIYRLDASRARRFS